MALTPSSIDGFYNAGISLIASATAIACYVANGILPAANMTVSGPATLTANFLPSIATNASSQVQVTRSGLIFNRTTGRFQQTVRLRNYGPTLTNVKLVIENLPPGWAWTNFDGLTQCAAPVGSRYKAATATLAPGGQVDIPVTFQPAAGGLNYSTRVLAGAGQP